MRIKADPAGFWATTILLLAGCLAAFGLLIPWLGFYQDDWYQVWFGRAFGAGIFGEYYAGERPFIAGIYMLTTPLIGEAPLGWHLFGLFWRWAAALVAFALVRKVWPAARRQAVWAALLFALYPGFRQQFASVIYSHYFLQLAVHLFSLWGICAAARRPRQRRLLAALSFLAALFSIFSSEYFFGLEALRPALLWLVLTQEGQRGGERLSRAALSWAPYLAVGLLFLYWRLFIFSFPTYQPIYVQHPADSPWQLAWRLAHTAAGDSLEAGALAWMLPAKSLAESPPGQPSTWAALALAASAFILFTWALRRIDREQGHAVEERRAALEMSLLATLGLLAAGWPFWFVELPVNLDLMGGSRFNISFMLAASWLAAGLIAMLRRPGWLRPLLLSALAGLAVGGHFLDANAYRQIHIRQAAFFQQLAWRAPGLKPGTLVLTNTTQDGIINGDNSLTAALNWIYDAQPPYALDYMLFYIPERLASGHIPALQPGLPVEKGFRTTQFQGSTSQALVVYNPYPECLRVLDPAFDGGLPRPVGMSKEMKEAAQLSNQGQIAPFAQPAVLSPALFKALPAEDSWCYYYEKADLARQLHDWQRIVALGGQAFSQPRKLASTWELAPFIEGYARAGEWPRARQLTREALDARPEGKWMTAEILCAVWRRVETGLGDNAGAQAKVDEMFAQLACKE
jgi:hypothetical protein